MNRIVDEKGALVAFKPAELKLIREHTFIGAEVEKRLRLGEAEPGGAVKVRLTTDNLDELLGYLSSACNHTSSPALQRKLDALYERLQRLEESLVPKSAGKTETAKSQAPVISPRLDAAQGFPGRQWTILESDWKHLKRVLPATLERLCARALEEVARVTASPDGTAHQRYRKAWAVLQARDKEVGLAFDHLKRSTALAHLTAMRHLDLVTEEEFAAFSEDLRHKVGLILSSWK